MQVVHNLVVLGALLLAVHTLEAGVGNQVVNHRNILGEEGALEGQTVHMVVVVLQI